MNIVVTSYRHPGAIDGHGELITRTLAIPADARGSVDIGGNQRHQIESVSLVTAIGITTNTGNPNVPVRLALTRSEPHAITTETIDCGAPAVLRIDAAARTQHTIPLMAATKFEVT